LTFISVASHSLKLSLTLILTLLTPTDTGEGIFTARCYASAVLALGLCLSVCLFVCPLQVGVLSKRMNESSWFCRVSFLPPVLHCVKRKFGYLQNKGTSLWNFFLNSRLGKFRHGISIVVTCYQLSSRKVDAQSVINWAILPSSDTRPL